MNNLDNAIKMYKDDYNVFLNDDGSLDTIINVNSKDIRYTYFDDSIVQRDNKGNIINWKELKEQAIDDYIMLYEV